MRACRRVFDTYYNCCGPPYSLLLFFLLDGCGFPPLSVCLPNSFYISDLAGRGSSLRSDMPVSGGGGRGGCP
jgi:hypothetical protein